MLSDQYQSYSDWKGWDAEQFAICSSLESSYFDAEIAKLGLATTTDLNVFEIGFGNGSFAAYATGRGWRYSGSEINPELVARAKERNFNVKHTGSDMTAPLGAKASLDLVVALDVIEHMTTNEILSILRSAHETLKSGGLFFARVPSGDSPFGRAILHGDITHRSALGSSAISQLATLSGFKLSFIASPAFPIRGNGMIRAAKRAAITVSRCIISKAINVIYHGGQPYILTANLVFAFKKD